MSENCEKGKLIQDQVSRLFKIIDDMKISNIRQPLFYKVVTLFCVVIMAISGALFTIYETKADESSLKELKKEYIRNRELQRIRDDETLEKLTTIITILEQSQKREK